MPPLIYRQADFEIHRDFRDEYEDDDLGDGNIFPNQTPYAPHEMVDDGPAPPIIVVVQGPPNVGKSLLIKSLDKYFNYSVQLNDDLQGPNTIRIDGTSRIQFVECADDINAMLDASKYADLVLLLVDASFEFEAETFEFLNILQAHGLPKIMGVFTHLDKFNDENKLEETKERLQDHFSTEICHGARIYNLTGLDHGLYKMQELQKLVQDIKTIEFPTLSWRVARPYVLVDRFEDVTPLEEMQKDANCKRNISLYGYLRGCNINSGAKGAQNGSVAKRRGYLL
ncbi:ribosome biogenesis protein BMS1 homolog [Papaver somniferum]|uniref:ribosome biogenesis protein BMS1 homolog n=1 Tax=Papaver somniferum TaxID=3469 RepID=UPI000E702AF0|nr:ribosome biogenesis protein BMS1 homolog [Papaver somniferum]